MQQRQGIAASQLGAAIALSAWITLTLVTCQRASVRAQAQPARAGSGVDALAGVHEVPLAVPSPERLNARLGLGYGWTESVLKMNDSHHRMQLDAAGSVTPLPWLSTALRVLGRYDVHTGGVSDSGVITETHLAARATWPLAADVHAGGQLSLWLPGGNTVASALSALSGELQLLLGYAPALSPITVGLGVGIRVDRSQYAGGQPLMYSAADRLALGVSDSIMAARQGLAVSYRMGRIEWVAEWACRLYFARIAESPMWIRAGARYRPTDRVQLELLVGVSPSQRPSLAEGAALAVIEPRVSAGLAATYSWPSPGPQPSTAEVPAAPKLQPQKPQAPPLDLRGQVRTTSGAGLAGATLTLRRGDSERAATSDAQGAFAFAALQPGAYVLHVVAAGFIADQRSLELGARDAPSLDVTLKRELPQGQIRGTVRRFNGTPVVASIAIAELGVMQQTRDDGSFEIDVPPGEYSVMLKARGFRAQTRKARVELHGVAILIVELEVAR